MSDELHDRLQTMAGWSNLPSEWQSLLADFDEALRLLRSDLAAAREALRELLAVEDRSFQLQIDGLGTLTCIPGCQDEGCRWHLAMGAARRALAMTPEER